MKTQQRQQRQGQEQGQEAKTLSRYRYGWKWCGPCEVWYSPEVSTKFSNINRCPTCGKPLRCRPRNGMGSCNFGMKGAKIVRY